MPASIATAPVVLITGAARRIGAAIARELHDAGCNLALHYHHSAVEMQALCMELEARRAGSTMSVSADLADAAAAPVLVEAAVAQFGHLDALVNNASAFHATPLETATADAWDALFACNARAPFLLAQAAATHLAERRGSIINLTDYYADHPPADFIPYAASKAALVAVTHGLARALAPNVRVNAVAPGAIAWPEQGADVDEQQAILDATLLARTGEPSNIANTVRWLVLEAGYVNNQVIHVDGGRV
ncbi:MAG TPA: pteridine reductase [Oleiagrimonas sp.]|nr:pteridine reductase [Oleiagrimonas sp.]